MAFFSGMCPSKRLMSHRMQLQNTRYIPIVAVKSGDSSASKTRRTRKAAAPSAEPSLADSTSNASTSAPNASSTSSLHRLHGTSDTLRALLERRAERQQRQMKTAGGSSAAPLAARPPAPLAPAEPPAAKGLVKVRFWLQFRVEYGQSIVVVGGSPELGKWVLSDGIPLSWSENDMWNCTLELPAGSVCEYKYVVVGQGGHAVAWQTGNNSVLAIRQADDVLDVYDNWGGNPGAQVVAAGAAPVTRESRLLSWATELEAQVASQRNELRRARMELVAAQEEAKLAREESKKLKVQLAQSEAQRVTAVTNLKQADTVNKLLQTQLVETQNSFTEALEKAIELMGPTKTASSSRKTAAAPAAAAPTAAAAKAPAVNEVKTTPVNGNGNSATSSASKVPASTTTRSTSTR